MCQSEQSGSDGPSGSQAPGRREGPRWEPEASTLVLGLLRVPCL